MDPKEWGRGFWLLIWVILYDEELFPDLIEVKKYLDLIIRNLPCDVCKEEAARKVKKYNIMSCTSRDTLKEFFTYVYSSTNTSNVRLRTSFD